MSIKLNFNAFKYNKIVVFIYLMITGLPTIGGSIINNLLFGLIIASIFLLLITSDGINIRNNSYLKWILVVVIILFISIIWAVNKDIAIGRFNRVILIASFCIYVSFLIKNKKDFNTALKLFVLSRIIMALYILIILDYNTLGEMRIGADNLGEDWNANSIGMNLALASFSVFFILKTEINKNFFKKFIYYLSILLFVFVTIFTGSRKALFILIFSIGLFSLLNRERNKIIKFGFIALLLGVITYMSLNIPVLYNVLGSRIDGFIANLTGQGVVDASTRTRMLMIDTGLEIFKEKPILGHGIDSFRQLYYNVTGDFRYSHNNYIELLVSIGLFGTGIYYIGLLSILRKSLYYKDNMYLIFSFVLIMTILIIDYGLVSYTSYLIQFFICLAFVSVRISGNKYLLSSLEQENKS